MLQPFNPSGERFFWVPLKIAHGHERTLYLKGTKIAKT